MKRLSLAVTVALTFASPALAAERTTEAFYADAAALKAKGAMALFSGKLRPLMQEGQATGEALRQQRQAAIKRGEKPTYCPPQNAKMGSEEMLSGLGAIPQNERRALPLSVGMLRVLQAKWPCR
ncbi:hypothetical protein [Novosphingobium sp.]|uniref:hypothetical protein n=1 Tax=Novosphingobium sp. TaxID=1874826 RepID=UPI0025CF3F5A|nr:hypothetical protein [Novosphingobium sp.]